MGNPDERKGVVTYWSAMLSRAGRRIEKSEERLKSYQRRRRRIQPELT